MDNKEITDTVGLKRYVFDGTFLNGQCNVKEDVVFTPILREYFDAFIVDGGNKELLAIKK